MNFFGDLTPEIFIVIAWIFIIEIEKYKKIILRISPFFFIRTGSWIMSVLSNLFFTLFTVGIKYEYFLWTRFFKIKIYKYVTSYTWVSYIYFMTIFLFLINSLGQYHLLGLLEKDFRRQCYLFFIYSYLFCPKLVVLVLKTKVTSVYPLTRFVCTLYIL